MEARYDVNAISFASSISPDVVELFLTSRAPTAIDAWNKLGDLWNSFIIVSRSRAPQAKSFLTRKVEKK